VASKNVNSAPATPPPKTIPGVVELKVILSGDMVTDFKPNLASPFAQKFSPIIAVSRNPSFIVATSKAASHSSSSSPSIMPSEASEVPGRTYWALGLRISEAYRFALPCFSFNFSNFFSACSIFFIKAFNPSPSSSIWSESRAEPVSREARMISPISGITRYLSKSAPL